jgi:VWFA-related protein
MFKKYSIFCLVLFFINLPFSSGQNVPAIPAEESDTDLLDPYKISVNVREVRLDVVVVDDKGRPITDLTADDFEIYQDKKPQEVASSIYVENQASPAASGKSDQNLLQLPVAALKKEDVSRTILFVVDDLSMQFASMHYAKMSIKNFLNKQMQPGDLVSVMYATSGNSAFTMFSSDKRQITALVDAAPMAGTFYTSADDPLYRVYDNQLLTLHYSIQALKDMPGRKILLFLTAMPTINEQLQRDILGRIPVSYTQLYLNRYNRLADEAMRAGVVVHMMDTRGLYCSEEVGPVGGTQPCVYDKGRAEDGLNPIPAKTGGLLIMDNNFFLDGIGKDVYNMIAGYYLVSYVPPPSTFELKNNMDVYHRVIVKVKRKGASVHTREGFYGRLESEAASKAPPVHPLQAAVFSPFKSADINVNMAAGYTKDEKSAYLVRSWIHLDPKNITIIETQDGGARVNLETLCLTSGINGAVHDARHAQYTFTITPETKSENIDWIQKHGIRFLMLLPVKKPGFYSIRIAVQDKESGRIGSAYQLVEIPDLRKKEPALSNIFILTSANDLDWMRSDVAKELAEGAFFAVVSKDETPSPALRTYMPGDSFHIMAMLYNADAKEMARSEIEVQSILYKDDKELLRGNIFKINPDDVESRDKSVTLLRKFTLGSDMQPGDYALQMLVTDKKYREKKEKEKENAGQKEGIFSRIMRAYLNEQDYNKKEKGVASQILGFTVMELSRSDKF